MYLSTGQAAASAVTVSYPNALITRNGAGNYTLSLDTTGFSAGVWNVVTITTGTGQATVLDQFEIKALPV